MLQRLQDAPIRNARPKLATRQVFCIWNGQCDVEKKGRRVGKYGSLKSAEGRVQFLHSLSLSLSLTFICICQLGGRLEQKKKAVKESWGVRPLCIDIESTTPVHVPSVRVCHSMAAVFFSLLSLSSFFLSKQCLRWSTQLIYNSLYIAGKYRMLDAIKFSLSEVVRTVRTREREDIDATLGRKLCNIYNFALSYEICNWIEARPQKARKIAFSGVDQRSDESG